MTVFALYSSSTTWLPRGKSIVGESEATKLGKSISLSSNGLYVVVGSPGDTDNGGIDSGQVQVFHWNDGESDWEGSVPFLLYQRPLPKKRVVLRCPISGNAEVLAVGAPVRGGPFDDARGYTRAYRVGEG